ncbi:hypothetical protein H0H93_015468, partial [Arthromyces matolae]
VTSLRSGTAFKSVFLYVTKYITKPTLKTYTAFEAVNQILSKNTEILDGPLPQQEKARTLMTKMVNVLSAKSEMGSPMICMYLLGNPDHYTDHTFVPLHWPSYVSEARREGKFINSEDQTPGSQKIGLTKRGNRVLAVSTVFDYIYRGKSLQSMSLYEWASRSERIKLPPKESGDGNPDIDHGMRAYGAKGAILVRFTKQHPWAMSHATLIHPPNRNRIPNLVGPPLPRRDGGDREFYCAAMLTLFKPWRSGLDLKADDKSWDTAFSNHVFSKRHTSLMNNMNL